MAFLSVFSSSLLLSSAAAVVCHRRDSVARSPITALCVTIPFRILRSDVCSALRSHPGCRCPCTAVRYGPGRRAYRIGWMGRWKETSIIHSNNILAAYSKEDGDEREGEEEQEEEAEEQVDSDSPHAEHVGCWAELGQSSFSFSPSGWMMPLPRPPVKLACSSACSLVSHTTYRWCRRKSWRRRRSIGDAISRTIGFFFSLFSFLLLLLVLLLLSCFW